MLHYNIHVIWYSSGTRWANMNSYSATWLLLVSMCAHKYHKSQLISLSVSRGIYLNNCQKLTWLSLETCFEPTQCTNHLTQVLGALSWDSGAHHSQKKHCQETKSWIQAISLDPSNGLYGWCMSAQAWIWVHVSYGACPWSMWITLALWGASAGLT